MFFNWCGSQGMCGVAYSYVRLLYATLILIFLHAYQFYYGYCPQYHIINTVIIYAVTDVRLTGNELVALCGTPSSHSETAKCFLETKRISGLVLCYGLWCYVVLCGLVLCIVVWFGAILCGLVLWCVVWWYVMWCVVI